MQIKTDRFTDVAKKALHDTRTRKFLDGMYANVKERLKSIRKTIAKSTGNPTLISL
jgi:hypothetical protein